MRWLACFSPVLEFDLVPIRVSHIRKRHPRHKLTSLFQSAAGGDNLIDRTIEVGLVLQLKTEMKDAAA